MPSDAEIRKLQAQAKKKQDKQIIENSRKIIEALVMKESKALQKGGKPKQIVMYLSLKKSIWTVTNEPGSTKGTLVLAKALDGTITVSCTSNLASVVNVCTLSKDHRVEAKAEEKKAVLSGLRIQGRGFTLRDSEYIAVYTEAGKLLELPIITQSGGRFYQEQDVMSGTASLVMKMRGVSYTVLLKASNDMEPAPFEQLVQLNAKLPTGTEQVTVPDPAPQTYLLTRPAAREFWEMDVYRVRVDGGDHDYYRVRTPDWDEIWANGQRATRAHGAIDFGAGTLTANGTAYSMYLHTTGFSHRTGPLPVINPATDPQAAATVMFTEYAFDLNRQYDALFTSNHNGQQIHVSVGEDWHGFHVHYSLPFDQWLPRPGRYARGHLTLETGDHITDSPLRFRYYWNTGFRPPGNIPPGRTTQDAYDLYAQDTTDNPPLASYAALRDQLAIDLPLIAARFQAQARNWP